jgi:hypothetical protein
MSAETGSSPKCLALARRTDQSHRDAGQRERLDLPQDSLASLSPQAVGQNDEATLLSLKHIDRRFNGRIVPNRGDHRFNA